MICSFTVYRKFDKTSACRAPPNSIKGDVWHTIAVDPIGPLPETPRINKFIMTVSCLFSIWPEATALPDKTAVAVVEFLLHETMDENLLTRYLLSSVTDAVTKEQFN